MDDEIEVKDFLLHCTTKGLIAPLAHFYQEDMRVSAGRKMPV
jgi:hypothetical protein